MTVAAMQAEACAVCGRPLTDALSISAAVGPDCRSQFGYYPDLLAADVRVEANRLLHAIAGEEIRGTELRDALFRLHELGFAPLSQRIERRVHRRIVVEMAAPAPTNTLPEAPVPVSLPFTLTDGQAAADAAVDRLMSTRGFGMCVVAGYAGVGKSTLLRVFGEKYGSRGKPVCIAPTGKAALRIREATRLDASTIHRWIYAPKEDPATGIVKFMPRQLQEIQLPPSKMVLLDEASMVGPEVWKDVYQVCKKLDVKLVCVGDAFQLPPVQAPNAAPFSILSPEFARHHGAERIELTEVLRQAQGSPTIRASMKLRAGWGLRALDELRPISMDRFAHVATEVRRAGGVTICHKNTTRAAINAGVRMMLGINDEQPQPGEPLVVLKNTYEAGLVNGESCEFGGWEIVPDVFERVFDRYKNVEEATRFGATRVGADQTRVVISLEELHCRLSAGPRAIEIAAATWARVNRVLAGDTVAPLLHANFGYGWTAHKAQGSEWPYVLVVVEPSVRLDEDEGRRWVYTAITRSREATAVYIGRI
jgi:exodeoxyribonuclease-5